MRCERLIRRMSSTTIGVLHGTGALCGIIALFGIAAHAAETSAPSGSAAGAARPGQSVLVRLPEGETPVGMAAGTSGKSNDLVVARVHALNDDELVVLLPSGRLGNVNKRGATLTARPFEPASKDDLAKALTERGALRGFKTKQTKRFLYVYNSSDTFYIGTSRILETMYPGLLAYCKRQKLDVQEAELPLVVVMFRTQDEFNRFREMPEGVVAYYDGVTNWVIMYEMSRLAQVAPDIALKQAISTVAHEGVH